MQKAITSREVNSIHPKDKPFEIRDTRLKGLLLRVQPSGVTTYYVEYKRGKRVKIGRGDAISPDEARDLAKNILAGFYKGEDPAEKKRKGKFETYLEFLEKEYKPWLASNLRTSEATFDNLYRFKDFHGLKLQEITPLLMEKWRLKRKKEGIKSSSINRQMNDLRACLNRAMQWGLLEENPFDKVKPFRVDSSPKVRFLSTEEEIRIRKQLDKRESHLKDGRESANHWRAERGYSLYGNLKEQSFADYLKPAVLLSLNTGLRRGELFDLKWSEVNLEQNILTVEAETTKTGSTRHIPLNEEAARILAQWKNQSGIKSQYVFSGKSGLPFQNLRKSWVAVLKSAQIDNFRWHDLRHTFASKLVMAGVDLNTVRELLGHSDYKMTLRYAHLAPEHKAAAVNKLMASVR